MKLTVLADNNTIIDRYYLGEPALSLLLEDDGEKILMFVAKLIGEADLAKA